MAKDMPDDLRYVVSGRVDDAGRLDLSLPLRRFPKTYREKEFLRLPFFKDGIVPEGFDVEHFVADHFVKGIGERGLNPRYIEKIFARPCVNLDASTILQQVKDNG